MHQQGSCPSISVRLEGGLGDHVLGMRVLRFIRDRYPSHEIVVYSDSGGHPTQLEVAALSPFVSRVLPVRQRAAPKRGEVGNLENVVADDRLAMESHDLFIDAHGVKMFARAASILDVPVFDILAHRPELSPTSTAISQADELLSPYRDAVLVGFNLTKYGSATLRRLEPTLNRLLSRILEDRAVVVLNLFTAGYRYNHWPERERDLRRNDATEAGTYMAALCDRNQRIVPCVDFPIATVVELLSRCAYFVGTDNGIKHLAWALDVPLTFFMLQRPTTVFALRWTPDIDRMLLCDAPSSALEPCIEQAITAIQAGKRSKTTVHTDRDEPSVVARSIFS